MAMEDFRKRFSLDPNLYAPEDLRATIPKFGEIPNVKVGATFENRKELSAAKVHTEPVAGISGSKRDGAYSVVLSGAYEDDEDGGDTFIYTGAGGRGTDGATYGGSAKQTEDQSFEHSDNMALKISSQTGKPVRVIRGSDGRSKYAPPTGYRYDGLYTVEDAYLDKGKSGYLVCKFTFHRLPNQPALPTLTQNC